jgi:hypothetical protein
MSANYSGAIVVSTPSAFTFPSGISPDIAHETASAMPGLRVDASWGDCVPPEKQGIPLSVAEIKQLRECEGFVKVARAAFFNAGQALATIRDGHLYRQNFRSFKDYCWERWRYGRAYSYRLIAGAQVVKWVSPIGDIIPECEWQIRAITAANLTKDEAIAVWTRAVQLAQHHEPSAKLVQVAVAELKFLPAGPKKHPRRKRNSLNPQSIENSILGLMSKAELSIRNGHPGDALKLWPEIQAEVHQLARARRCP